MLDNVIRDDFAGPGGWDEGLRILRERGAGQHLRMVGIEFDKAACDTAALAGHLRIHGDVREQNSEVWIGIGGYIASPPCQPFSAAGKGEGRKHLDALVRAANLVAVHGALPADAVAHVHDEALDDRSILVLEPLRVIARTRPRWVALEQVKEVLPIWQVYADLLDRQGYACRTEVVSAERYGVPQTRKRAILIAVRRDVMDAHHLAEVPWPTPTHSAYYPRNPAKLDEGVLPWVSMADALSWPPGEVISNYGTGGDPRNRGRRGTDQPAATVTSKVDRNVVRFGDVRRSNGTIRDLDQPAPTITASADNGNFRFVAEAAVEGDTTWVERRPSPTIVGSFAPDVVAAPGWRKPGDPPRQKTPGSVRITVEQAGILQSFPADYPWQGNKGQQYQQVGNAIPALLAAAFLKGLVTL